jgi:hypothetical protein
MFELREDNIKSDVAGMGSGSRVLTELAYV